MDDQKVDPDLRELTKRCLGLNANKRKDIESFFTDPYFKQKTKDSQIVATKILKRNSLNKFLRQKNIKSIVKKDMKRYFTDQLKK